MSLFLFPLMVNGGVAPLENNEMKTVFGYCYYCCVFEAGPLCETSLPSEGECIETVPNECADTLGDCEVEIVSPPGYNDLCVLIGDPGDTCDLEEWEPCYQYTKGFCTQRTHSCDCDDYTGTIDAGSHWFCDEDSEGCD